MGTLLRSLGQGHDLQRLGNGAKAFKYELGIVFATLQEEEGPNVRWWWWGGTRGGGTRGGGSGKVPISPADEECWKNSV